MNSYNSYNSKIKKNYEDNKDRWNELTLRYKDYKLSQLYELDDNVLLEISLIKNKIGNATKLAYSAQLILQNKKGGFHSPQHWRRDHTVVKQF